MQTSNGPIIVGIDGAERSADAIALGDLLAERSGAQLMLVHVRPLGANSKAAEQYEQVLQLVLDSTICRERQPKLRTAASRSPAAGLEKVARREQAQLIVVGPSHRSGLGRVRPGSVGDRLLSGSPVPVAVATRGYANQPPRLDHLAAGFDGSAESSDALRWAVSLAERSNGRVRLVSVHTPLAFTQVPTDGGFTSESVNREMRRHLTQQQAAAIAANGSRLDGAMRDGDAATVLIDASWDADMLIMGSRSYGVVRSVLLGSVSQKVIRHATCPVVVVPRSATHGQRPRPMTARPLKSEAGREAIALASAASASESKPVATQMTDSSVSGPRQPREPMPRLDAIELDDRCLRVLRDRA